MVAMATSLSCRLSVISAFCWPTTQTPSITNSLVAIVHTKPVMANCVSKLVAMATFLSTSGPYVTHDSLGQFISIGSVVFAQMTTECAYTLQWDAAFPAPSKLPLPIGGGV